MSLPQCVKTKAIGSLQTSFCENCLKGLIELLYKGKYQYAHIGVFFNNFKLSVTACRICLETTGSTSFELLRRGPRDCLEPQWSWDCTMSCSQHHWLPKMALKIQNKLLFLLYDSEWMGFL